MDLAAFAANLEATALGQWMRTSLRALPVIESIHVMAISIVFGTILIVDLRLLGLPNTSRSFIRMSEELLRLTWIAFVIAAITGAMMFVVNATAYYDNLPFRLKMLMLVAGGINMALFHFFTGRSAAAWDRNVATPLAGRIAGGLSIVIWTTVIFLGRLIGFTKGYDFEIPTDVPLDFTF